MRKYLNLTFFITVSSLLLAFMPAAEGVHYAGNLLGRILIQVEKNGEAWYVYPGTGQRYFLGRPADAFSIMRSMALGATSDFIAATEIFPERLSGMILLDAEKNGEAYYIYPGDKKKYYLGRPADAFRIMSGLGLGITDRDLGLIPEGGVNDGKIILPDTDKILLEVPFTSQAPFGGWDDQRQQDGCEESSSLMAVRWARGENLTGEEALREILAASDYIERKYGEYRDISSADTVDWIIKDYFGHPDAVLKKGVSIEDIVAELEKGNLVIAPMDGQLLHNPNYKQPGPPRHMLVIRGYDPVRKIFITNDPGTRRGAGYEYDAAVLFGAMRDYPTGYHEFIDKIEKNIIIITR